MVARVPEHRARQRAARPRPRPGRPPSRRCGRPGTVRRGKPIEPPRGRTHVNRSAQSREELVEALEVRGHDPARPGQDAVAGTQPDEREDLRRRRRADRRVVLRAPRTRPSRSRSWLASQPIRRPAIANDFDMTPERDAALERVGAGRAAGPPRRTRGSGRPRRRGGGCRASTARRSARPTRAAVGIIPVGLCGALTTTSRVAGVRAASRRGTSSDQPSVLVQLMEGDVGAGRPADLVQALVAGPRARPRGRPGRAGR